MARTRQTLRKNTGPNKRRWHFDTTAAAEQGGSNRIARARTAERMIRGNFVFEPDVSHIPLQHPGETGGMTAPQNPFSAKKTFGMLPYAAWHGYHNVVADFIQRGAGLQDTAKVRALCSARESVPCSVP